MKNFTKGLLVGVGVGLLVAPLSGQETRRLLAARIQEWRDSLPEDSRINQYADQIADCVATTRGNWQGYAQQAVSKAKDTSSTFGNKAITRGQDMAQKARQTGADMAQKARQSGQDIAQKARQTGADMAQKARRGTGYSDSSSNGASTRIITPDIED